MSKGAPKSNLNASRNPVRSWIKRRALIRDEDQELLTIYKRCEIDLLADKPEASNAQTRMIEICAMARVGWLLVFRQLGEGEMDVSEAMTLFARLAALEASTLKSLGLEREVKKINPMELLKSYGQED